jgi:hypothetical protein
VVGRGGREQGTGVLGMGGGIHDANSSGVGGMGLHGVGGSLPDPDVFPETPPAPPGAGVVGQGGRQSRNQNTEGLAHGAGVIGIGGGKGPQADFLPTVDLTMSGSVGVYGQGAEQSVEMVHDPAAPDGPLVPSGPTSPGTGIVGRGGQPSDPVAPGAAGVVGLAGGEHLLAAGRTAGIGVYGAGSTGVHGFGPDRETQAGAGVTVVPGIGVRGVATGKAGRGGRFESARSAQLQLVPMRVPRPFPAPKPATASALPTAADEGGVADFLPRDGQGGDLVTLTDAAGASTLWFCSRGDGQGQAEWGQVLLGPVSLGTA